MSQSPDVGYRSGPRDAKVVAFLLAGPMGILGVTLTVVLARTTNLILDSWIPALLVADAAIVGMFGFSLCRRRISNAEFAAMLAVVTVICALVAASSADIALNQQLSCSLCIPPVMAALTLPARVVGAFGGVCLGATFVVLVVRQGLGARMAEGFLVILVLLVITTGVLMFLRRNLDAALERAERLAVTDYLTGMLNRRGLSERFEPLMAATMRRKEWLAVLVLDLDRFKLVNDRFGHSAGDLVLRGVALALEEVTRAEDLLVRLGGEEFAVIAAVHEDGEGARLAQRLREKVSQVCRTPDGGVVTISVGVVTTQVSRDDRKVGVARLDELLSAADRLLYRAKEDGRDRVRAA